METKVGRICQGLPKGEVSLGIIGIGEEIQVWALVRQKQHDTLIWSGTTGARWEAKLAYV
jgi:hypothetical protein